MTSNTAYESTPPGDSTAAALESLEGAAGSAAERAAASTRRLKAEAGELFDRVKPRLEAVTAYVKTDPMRTLLIAAACGAVVMGVVTLAARPSVPRLPRPSRLRRFVESAADRAARYADETVGRASAGVDDATKSARDTAKSTRESARDAATSALDSLAETVQEWRDRAAPLVDRLKPQIETVTDYAKTATDYAKNEPIKSVAMVAAAGALLAGLLALVNQDDES